MKTVRRIVFAFALGQAVQLVLQTVAKVAYMNRPILFCVAAGFLVAVAVVAGVALAEAEDE